MIVNQPGNTKAWMEDDGKITGRIRYEIEKDVLVITQLTMLGEIGMKLIDSLRPITAIIRMVISEYDDITREFLISYGFRAIGIKRNWVRKGVDGYIFSLLGP